jgi:phage-related protein
MKPIRFHPTVVRELEKLEIKTRSELAELLSLLASGESLGMPVSRPMPVVRHGVHELRLQDRSGQLRIFYFVNHEHALPVFHCFRKKTRATTKRDLETARKRLGEMV